MRFIKFVIKWFSIFSFLLAILFGGIWFLFQGVQKLFHKSLIIVPNFKGLSLVEVLENRPKGLHLEILEKKKSLTIPKGYIIEQTPKSGERVKEGRRLLMTISLGSDSISVPSFIGKSFRKSNLILRNLGLSVGTKAFIKSKDSGQSKVLSQSPKSGELALKGSVVSFLLSKPVKRGRRLPMLEEHSLSKAKEILLKSNLSLGKIRKKSIPGFKHLEVLEQFPPAGNILKIDEKVDLVINNIEETNENKQIKTIKVDIKLPPGLKRQFVKVDKMDFSGKKTIYEKSHSPATSFSLKVKLKGSGYLNIYLDDIFYKKIKLSGEVNGINHRANGY
ncbi:MAG: hypothetical protein COB02_03380 [Candidatus Cloacimonadota bacterium]|nr:MAG: hypothetical protein COB02_03380 [Candidatus Cloacimonadota bacterium]